MSVRFERGMRQFRKDEDPAKAGLAKLLSDGSALFRKLYGPIDEQEATPPRSRGAQSTSAEKPPLRLKPIEFAIEIPVVSEELYNRTREAVENAGYNFVVPIRSVSIEELLVEDRQREQDRQPRRLGFVNESKTMRATVPPEMEVAINPARFQIAGSNRLPTDEQKRRIKQEQATLRGQVPDDIQHLVIMEMVDPSTISQVEDKYMDENNGALLLPDWFARTGVQTVRGHVAHVGRYAPARRRSVGDWLRGHGYDDVFGAAVVVLPRKLAA